MSREEREGKEDRRRDLCGGTEGLQLLPPAHTQHLPSSSSFSLLPLSPSPHPLFHPPLSCRAFSVWGCRDMRRLYSLPLLGEHAFRQLSSMLYPQAQARPVSQQPEGQESAALSSSLSSSSPATTAAFVQQALVQVRMA